MALIPGVQLNISGASGSQGLLAPKSGWFAYIFPRGGYASADSTGTTITFDSSDIAGRFAVNDWTQVGIDTSKIRKVVGVGGNSITVQTAVTVSENNRVFIIGATQPSTSGGSATYIIPRTTIRTREDDSADRITNSMVTTNSDGLVEFYTDPGVYDCLIQDANQTAQGYIANLPVGVAEAVSTTFASVFGATVTFNGAAVFASTASFTGIAGFSGPVIAGATLTVNGQAGFTGHVAFGTTISVTGTSGNYSHSGTVILGNTVTLSGALGVTGMATLSGPVAFGATATFSGPTLLQGTTTIISSPKLQLTRLAFNQEVALGSTYFALSAGWGASASITVTTGSRDSAFAFKVHPLGAGIGASPTVTVTYASTQRFPADLSTQIASRWAFLGQAEGADQPTVPFIPYASVGGTFVTLMFCGTPVSGSTYGCAVITVGNA